MKKKLVLEYWSSKGRKASVPAQYALSRQNWVCEIIFENIEGVIDEFEVTPKGKMYLKDLLPYLKDKLDDLVPGDAVDCGFRIYRCK